MAQYTFPFDSTNAAEYSESSFDFPLHNYKIFEKSYVIIYMNNEMGKELLKKLS